tara:strand:+ start:979 stop:1725 length:747 start_codon:yes stop_codon:yes gene_type:complete
MNDMFKIKAKNVAPSPWPNSFDFDTDPVCQEYFKPFIEEHLNTLREYDETRDLKSDYVFHKHVQDAAQDVRETCMNLGLGSRIANNMYHATLIHDLGKPELPAEIWDYEDSPPDEIKALKREHVDIGHAVFARQFADINHPFKDLALDIIRNHHERMDGLGQHKMGADEISDPVRLVCIVEDYDGRTHLRAHHKEMGLTNDAPAVFERMEEKCDGWFDPEIYEAFKTIKLEQHYAAQNLEHEDRPQFD